MVYYYINNHQVDEDDAFIKIADFSLTCSLEHDLICYDACGTSGFKAPEVLDNLEGYNGFLSDVWSLGITLYLFVNDGCFPWTILSINDLDNATIEN